MPAVTADTTTLPRVVAGVGARDRMVRSITTAPQGHEGEGFPVRRAFHGVSLADLDPFIHMDQMGEINYAPYEPKGTPWHPHRGFETVTYMIDGTFLHQDSHGGGGVIQNGATQWMTAGRGILHIETPPEDLVIRGGLFHGIQLWVNLPSKSKMIAPAYQNLEGENVKLLSSEDGGALIRLIAGNLGEHQGPGSTRTPIVMAHVTLAPGAQMTLPWNANYNALAYMLAGSGAVGIEATHKKSKPTANHFFILRNGQKSVLATYDAESSVLLRVQKTATFLLGLDVPWSRFYQFHPPLSTKHYGASRSLFH